MSQKILLEDIIQQLVDPKQSLEGPLLKLKFFALQTKNKQLEKFLNNEIQGYEIIDEVPVYRKWNCQIRADLKVGLEINYNQNIEINLFPNELRDSFRIWPLMFSISILENHISIFKQDFKIDSVKVYFNLELHQLILDAAKKRYTSMGNFYPLEIVGAKRVLGISALISCISSLRSKLIEFCYEAANLFDYEIDITSFNNSQNLNNQKITQIMNQTIFNNSGDGNLITTGNNNQITSSVNITKGDIESLKSKLKDLGIDTSDIAEVEDIINTEPLASGSTNLSHRMIDWITTVYGKSLKGLGNISKGITTELLVEFIKQYLGIN